MTGGPSPFDLSGRRALVTGSSRGIGLALARALGHAGAELILNGRDVGALVAAAGILRDEGLTVHDLPFDVCDPAAVIHAVDSVEVEIGPIDVLVNNAGLQRRAPLLELRSRTSASSSKSTWLQRSPWARPSPGTWWGVVEARSSISAPSNPSSAARPSPRTPRPKVD